MCLPVTAQNSQEIVITRDYKGIPIQTILNDIEERHQVRFFYREDWLFTDKINHEFIQQPVTDVLDILLESILHLSILSQILLLTFLCYNRKRKVRFPLLKEFGPADVGVSLC